MTTAFVKVQIIRSQFSEVMLPQYQTNGSVGADLKACIDEPIVLAPGEIRKIPCGFAVAVPLGWEATVRSRSGLASKHIKVANSPGTIDPDYRGEVCVLLENSHDKLGYTISPGDRIAQMVISPVNRAVFQLVQNLDQTERGDGGFGSTGVS